MLDLVKYGVICDKNTDISFFIAHDLTSQLINNSYFKFDQLTWPINFLISADFHPEVVRWLLKEQDLAFRNLPSIDFR